MFFIVHLVIPLPKKIIQLDFDIKNCQLQILLELAKLQQNIDVSGLDEYCNDPTLCKNRIIEYYELKDFTDNDGVLMKAKEQAKKLPLSLAFGGGIDKWREKYVKTVYKLFVFVFIQLKRM